MLKVKVIIHLAGIKPCVGWGGQNRLDSRVASALVDGLLLAIPDLPWLFTLIADPGDLPNYYLCASSLDVGNHMMELWMDKIGGRRLIFPFAIGNSPYPSRVIIIPSYLTNQMFRKRAMA